MTAIAIDELLTRPVEEGVRRRALDLLDEATRARGRLDDDADVEAVHDFRVALRRLRSLLKAHRPWLGRRLGRFRGALGDVASAMGAARDAEVQLIWLETQRARVPRTARPALEFLAGGLAARKTAGYDEARRTAGPAFDALAPRLRRRLARCRIDLDAKDRTLGADLAELLAVGSDHLVASLAAVGGVDDEHGAHAARIEGKRLRYLLEPLAASAEVGETVRAVIKELKALQETLGELHDAHVLLHAIAAAVASSTTLRGGMTAVRKLVAAQRDVLHVALLAGRDAAPALAERVRAIATTLGAPSRGVEIERKYLLSGMPDVGSAEWADLEQGYVPGSKLVERLRRTRRADGSETLIRGMKLGAGVTRVEVEEPIPPDLWKKMWPLTAGRRLKKRRFKVPDGDLVWEIDRFAGLDLVLAEVELPTEDTPVVPPPWLAPLIVREVTTEKEFTNASLALKK